LCGSVGSVASTEIVPDVLMLQASGNDGIRRDAFAIDVSRE
jgi:hypothetical protein